MGLARRPRGGTTRCLRVALVAGAALTFAALPAGGQTAQSWNGSASTDWFTAGNWDSNTVPVTGDSATLNTVTPNPTVAAGTAVGYAPIDLNGLNVGFTATGSLTVNNGASFTITNNNAVIGGDLSGIPGGGNGMVVVDGATFNVTNTAPATGGLLVIGGSSTGAFTAQNGAVVNTVDSHVGFGPGSNGTATVTGATSQWNNSGDSFVGNRGTGVFNVLDGATVFVGGNTYVGSDTGGNGTININGSTWLTFGATFLGGNPFVPTGGTATINVSNGGNYRAFDEMFIGIAPGSTANLNVIGGTVDQGANAYLGISNGSTGIVTISGSTAAWNGCVCADLTIGGNEGGGGNSPGGKGIVNVLNGGTMNLLGVLNLGRDDGTGTANGTLNVNGPNSTVTVTSGGLNSVFIGRNGTGAINITNGGVLTTDGISYLGYRRGATGTVVIDGASSRWDVTGPGVVVGGNTGTLTGGNGTVTVRNGGTFNSADVLLGFDSTQTSHGEVTVTGAGSAWNAGNVSLGVGGSGAINILDRAVFSLTGDLSVATCFCSAGTMNVSGQSTVTIGGAWTVGEDGTGTMTIAGTGTSVTTAGFLTVGQFGTGTLTIQDGASATVNGSGFGTSIIGQFAGASGTVTVTGAGSSLTVTGDLGINPFGISSGVLNVLDGAQATIGGGFLNADRFAIGAGSAVMAGTYFQGSNATTTIGLRGSSAGWLNVSGTAGLDGALAITGHNVGRTTYTLVHSADLGGSRFSSVSYTDPLLRNPQVTYTSGDVLLTVDPYLLISLVPTTANTNQQNVARAIDNALAAGATPSSGLESLFFLPGDALLNALTQVAGEPGASIPQAGFAAMGQFVNAMMDGAGGNGGQGGGAAGFADEDTNAYAPKRKLSRAQANAYAAVTPRDRMDTPFGLRWNVWATGYGGNATINGDTTTGSHSTSTRVYGTAVGADYRISPDTRVGFAAGGAGTNFSVDGALGGGRADVFQMGAYARHRFGAAYVAGALAYAWQDITTDRTVTVSGTDKLRAQFKANALSARLEGGWRYGMLPVAVTPYAALQSTAFYLPSYAESATSGGNQFALSYGSKTVTATRGELGARFDKAMPFNEAVVTLRGRAAWAHDWNTDRSAIATFQSLPGSTFTVNGAQPAANAALLSAGVDLAWGNGWMIAATFDGELSSTTRGYTGKGALRRVW